MSQDIDFSKNPGMRSLMGFVKNVFNAIEETQGIKFKGLNFNPDSGPDQSFEIKEDTILNLNGRIQNIKGRKIRINATVPGAELFSLAQELVRPADETFAARDVFAVDDGFHEGSQEIGYDVLSQGGRATLVPTGQSASANTPKADVTVGRKLNPVGKIQNFLEVTRDDMQTVSLRNDRGMGPVIDLISEKLTAARKNVLRVEDQIAWQGGSFDDSVEANEIPGFFDSLSTDSALFLSDSPSKGQRAVVADGVAGSGATKKYWGFKTADEIIADIRPGVKYVQRNGVYQVNTMAIDHQVLIDIALKRTSDTDSTPIIEWIMRTFKTAFKIDLNIVPTNALTKFDNTDLSGGFLLLDSRKEHQAISGVEALTVLPSITEADGTIKQFVQMKTGGTMVKHPSAAYLGIGISDNKN